MERLLRYCACAIWGLTQTARRRMTGNKDYAMAVALSMEEANMPPKFRYTREEIIHAALALAREGGMEAVTAKRVGARLHASVKLVFGQFTGMEEVRQEVREAAFRLWQDAMREAVRAGDEPLYMASGMAYIRFAREERELFRLLFMRDRFGEAFDDRANVRPLLEELQRAAGLSEDEACRVHTEMWMFVHGMATAVATSYLPWDDQLIRCFLTDAYLGLRARFARDGRQQPGTAADRA